MVQASALPPEAVQARCPLGPGSARESRLVRAEHGSVETGEGHVEPAAVDTMMSQLGLARDNLKRAIQRNNAPEESKRYG